MVHPLSPSWKIGICLLLTLGGIHRLPGQCPTIHGLMVNACAAVESDGEFAVLVSGGGFAVDELGVDLSSNSTAVNEDIGFSNDCSFKRPTAVLPGCPTAIPLGPGGRVPANAVIVLFTSGAATGLEYDFSGLCATGRPVYILQNECVRTDGAFRDFCVGGCGTRDTRLFTATGCESVISYAPGSLANFGNGDYYVPTADPPYGNMTCQLPPPVLPACDLDLSATATNPSCGANDGGIDLTVTGGTPPLQYRWSDAAIGNLPDPRGLGAGVYQLTVVDAGNCQDTLSVTLSWSPIVVQLERALCLGETLRVGNTVFDQNNPSGRVSLPGAGQNGCDSLIDVELAFYPNTIGQLRDTLCAGEQLTLGNMTFSQARPSGQAVLENGNRFGCDSTVLVNLFFRAPQSASLSGNAAICPGDTAGLTLRLPPGRYDVTYGTGAGVLGSVRGVADGDLIRVAPTSTTVYQLISVSGVGGGCPLLLTGTARVTVEPLRVELAAERQYQGYDLSCADAADGALRAAVVAGTGPFTYRWSTGATTAGIDGLTAGRYSLSLTNATGCEVVDSIELIAPDSLTFTASALAAACEPVNGGEIVIQAVAGGAAPYRYQLGTTGTAQALAAPQRIDGLSAGPLELLVSDANGCLSQATLQVDAGRFLELDLGEDRQLRLGDSLTLTPTLNFEPVSYEWSPATALSTTTDLRPSARPFRTTTYTLTARDSSGCGVSDRITLVIRTDDALYAPTAFSPNNDGVNDRFTLFAGPGVQTLRHLRIYDRWGNLLYDTTGFTGAPDDGWDGAFRGQPMPAGTYVYQAEVVFIDGREVVIKGAVVLVR